MKGKIFLLLIMTLLLVSSASAINQSTFSSFNIGGTSFSFTSTVLQDSSNAGRIYGYNPFDINNCNAVAPFGNNAQYVLVNYNSYNDMCIIGSDGNNYHMQILSTGSGWVEYEANQITPTCDSTLSQQPCKVDGTLTLGGGTYNVTDTIWLNDNDKLYGNGSTLEASISASVRLNGTNNELRDITINGNVNGALLVYDTSNNGVIDNVNCDVNLYCVRFLGGNNYNVTNIYGEAFIIANANDIYANNVTLIVTDFQTSSTSFTVTDSYNVLVENSYFEAVDSFTDTFWVAGQTLPTYNITVRNSEFYDVGGQGRVSLYDNAFGSNTYDITLEDNTFNLPVYVASDNVTLKNNIYNSNIEIDSASQPYYEKTDNNARIIIDGLNDGTSTDLNLNENNVYLTPSSIFDNDATIDFYNYNVINNYEIRNEGNLLDINTYCSESTHITCNTNQSGNWELLRTQTECTPSLTIPCIVSNGNSLTLSGGIYNLVNGNPNYKAITLEQNTLLDGAGSTLNTDGNNNGFIETTGDTTIKDITIIESTNTPLVINGNAGSSINITNSYFETLSSSAYVLASFGNVNAFYIDGVTFVGFVAWNSDNALYGSYVRNTTYLQGNHVDEGVHFGNFGAISSGLDHYDISGNQDYWIQGTDFYTNIEDIDQTFKFRGVNDKYTIITYYDTSLYTYDFLRNNGQWTTGVYYGSGLGNPLTFDLDIDASYITMTKNSVTLEPNSNMNESVLVFRWINDKVPINDTFTNKYLLLQDDALYFDQNACEVLGDSIECSVQGYGEFKVAEINPTNTSYWKGRHGSKNVYLKETWNAGTIYYIEISKADYDVSVDGTQIFDYYDDYDNGLNTSLFDTWKLRGNPGRSYSNSIMSFSPGWAGSSANTFHLGNDGFKNSISGSSYTIASSQTGSNLCGESPRRYSTLMLSDGNFSVEQNYEQAGIYQTYLGCSPAGTTISTLFNDTTLTSHGELFVDYTPMNDKEIYYNGNNLNYQIGLANLEENQPFTTLSDLYAGFYLYRNSGQGGVPNIANYDYFAYTKALEENTYNLSIFSQTSETIVYELQVYNTNTNTLRLEAFEEDVSVRISTGSFNIPPTSVSITSPVGSYVLNSTGQSFNFIYSESEGVPTPRYDVYLTNGVLNFLVRENTTLTNFNEILTSTDVPVADNYEILVDAYNIEGNTESYSGYTINLCSNLWTPQYTTCVNDTQIKTYYDANLCSLEYDRPLDHNTSVVCDDGILSVGELDQRNLEFKENLLVMIIMLALSVGLIVFYLASRSSLVGILTTLYFFLIGLYLFYQYPNDWILGVGAFIISAGFGMASIWLNRES